MSIEKAIETIQSEVDILRKKVDENIPQPKKLQSYSLDHPIFKYRLEHITDDGNYFHRNYPRVYNSIEIVETRRDNLLKILDELETNGLTNVKPHNEEVINHNRRVVEIINLFMRTIGIPETYTATDPKSRARIPKKITHRAGYKQDIERNISLSDTLLYNFTNTIKNKRNEITKWSEGVIADIRSQEALKIAEERFKKEANVLATLRVKYGLEYDSELDDISEVILGKDKYLRLAYYLELNREDWNDGPYYASVGIDSFKIESEQDQEIEDEIGDLIHNWEGDGRVFRDCQWSYGALYGLSNPELYKDLMLLKEISGHGEF